MISSGFVDPKDPSNPTKFLAPEALRYKLHNDRRNTYTHIEPWGEYWYKDGRRFVDELSLRSQVAPAIFTHGFRIGSETGAEENGYIAAYMLLNDEAVDDFGAAALKFYTSKK